MSVSLAELVARLGGELLGDGTREVESIAALDQAGPRQLSFLTNPKYRPSLPQTKAAAVILTQDLAAECPVAAIVTPQPYLYFARAAQILAPKRLPLPGIHPSAVVEGVVAASATIGPNVWIGADSVIGENVVIEANCTIGRGCQIGNDSLLYAGVHVYDHCQIGERAIVHSGVVIGSDGFGFAREQDGSWVKIPQIGRVLIGNDVEIGANTTIDRGAIDDTVIGNGVKLDNQIQIAHNNHVGEHSAIAGCVGIAGSTRIGSRVTIGGAAMIIGHLEIGDNVHIAAGTFVGKSIKQAGQYTGSVPFMTHGEWLRNFSHLRHLSKLADKIRVLESRLAELETKS